MTLNTTITVAKGKFSNRILTLIDAIIEPIPYPKYIKNKYGNAFLILEKNPAIDSTSKTYTPIIMAIVEALNPGIPMETKPNRTPCRNIKMYRNIDNFFFN